MCRNRGLEHPNKSTLASDLIEKFVTKFEPHHKMQCCKIKDIVTNASHLKDRILNYWLVSARLWAFHESRCLIMPATWTWATCLTLLWRRSLLYRNQSIDLQIKSMDWFLYDGDLRHKRVNELHKNTKTPAASVDVIPFRLKIYPKIEFFHLFFSASDLTRWSRLNNGSTTN